MPRIKDHVRCWAWTPAGPCGALADKLGHVHCEHGETARAWAESLAPCKVSK